MTWETPDRNLFKTLLPSLFFGGLAFVLVIKFFAGGEPTNASYESTCQEQGGEWLLNASRPTCVFPGGRLAYFDEPLPAGTVEAADEPITPATDPAPECGFGKVGEFADYPATESFKGRPHKPDFSTMPKADKYRTAITKDVARGVNFGGAYVIATWGKPEKFNETKTIGYAVVDARDGRIIEYGPSAGQPNNSGAVLGIDFQKNSRFFRVHTSIGPVAELISDDQIVQCGRY